MECSKCGAVIENTTEPCPECGQMPEGKNEIGTILKHVFEEEEDTYTPKFEEVGKTSGANGSPTDQKKSGNNNAGKSASGKTTVRTLGDKVVVGLRYALAAIIVLFTVSMFFNWFTLKGNGVNIGMLRTASVSSFLDKDIQGISPENLDNYADPIVTFSGMDLFWFGRRAADEYSTVIGPSGADTTSIVSVIQKYYMQAVILMLIINLVSLVLVLLFRSLRGIGIVRNLSVLNLFIVGLNYLTLKVPWLSMIAVKAKDILNQQDGYHEISIAGKGILFDDKIYRYEMYQEKGLTFAVVMLTLWLLVAIVLAEIKHRKEEIAIEKGEIE